LRRCWLWLVEEHDPDDDVVETEGGELLQRDDKVQHGEVPLV